MRQYLNRLVKSSSRNQSLLSSVTITIDYIMSSSRFIQSPTSMVARRLRPFRQRRYPCIPMSYPLRPVSIRSPFAIQCCTSIQHFNLLRTRLSRVLHKNKYSMCLITSTNSTIHSHRNAERVPSQSPPAPRQNSRRILIPMVRAPT
jgi:hypothetical protein